MKLEFTAEMIAGMVQGTVEGDPKAIVNDFAKIEEGRPGCISFLANPKYAHYLYETKSSVVLVNRDFQLEGKTEATLIRVDNAYETIPAGLCSPDGEDRQGRIPGTLQCRRR